MLLGVDIGTSSMKIGVYDPEGVQYYLNRISYQPNFPHEGRAEMDPLIWWESLVQLLTTCPVDLKAQINAMSFSGQMHGVVATDISALPLHPAILWLDQRGKDKLALFPQNLLAQHGNEPYLGALGISVLWLKKHKAEVFAKTHQFLSPKDWLRAYLTGTFNTELSDASGTLLTNLQGGWHEPLIADLGLVRHQLPDIIPSSQSVGTLLADKADALGLAHSVMVIMGGGDTACATLGAGLHYNPNRMMLTIGTGMQLLKVSDTVPVPKRGLNIFALPDTVDDHHLWYQMAAMLNGGSVLEWVRQQFGLSWDEMYEEAFHPHQSHDDLSIVALPWLNGERSPWLDATLSAGWKNLKAHHSRCDMIHAMFRSVALSIRFGLEAFDYHESVQEIIFAGGGSVHPLWRQLIANGLNKKLQCLEDADLSVRGAALLAGIGSGVIQEGEKTSFMPKVCIMVEPEPNEVQHLAIHKERLYKEVLCL